jgi:hypothetical protein
LAGAYQRWLEKRWRKAKNLQNKVVRLDKLWHPPIGRLTEARDFEAVLQIQNEFIHSQLKAFGEQAGSLGETSIKSAIVAAKK